MLFDKKNAIVYGAGGAVGRAVAQAFAAQGARVAFSLPDVATFLASDRAAAFTGAVTNLTGGLVAA